MVSFETLPPEIRSVIYKHLLSNAIIYIYHNGTMSTTQYPYQISSVSRLLRQETLPLLHHSPSSGTRTFLPIPIRLSCEGGRFPEHIRRRIPSHILHCIGTITLYTTPQCKSLLYDELKPTATTFPRLAVLEIDLCVVKVCMVRMMTRHARRQKRQRERGRESVRERLSRVESEFESAVTGHDAWCIEVRRVLEEMAWELHVEQERPREGLERDYIADNTLFEFLMKSRAARGFRVMVQAEELSFTNNLGVLPGVSFDWDEIREDVDDAGQNEAQWG